MMIRYAAAAVASLALTLGGCADSNSPEGTYEHDSEGIITLSEGGVGTWEQEGDDEPFEFEWEEDGDAIVLSTEDGAQGEVMLDDEGNLVLPPDLISGDEDVTFERQ